MYINLEAPHKDHLCSKKGEGPDTLPTNLQKLCSPSAALHELEKKYKRGGEKTNKSVIPGQERQKQEREGPEMAPSTTQRWNGS